MLPFWNFLGALAGGIVNAVSQGITNKKNRDFAAAQTQAQWERDDNAHQREVADLKAAGLSPLASTQGAVTGDPLGFQAQAPQVDVNALIQGALADNEIKMRQQELNFEKEKFYVGKGLEEKFHSDEMSMRLQELNETIRNNNMLNERAKENITATNRQLDIIQEQNSIENLRESQKILLDNLYKNYHTTQHTNYDDYNLYRSAYSKWINDRADFIATLGNDSEDNSESSSTGWNANLEGKVTGTGAGIGGGYNSAETSKKSFNQSTKLEQQLSSWYDKNPVPIYIGNDVGEVHKDHQIKKD